MSVWISWLHKTVNIRNIHSLYFYLLAIKHIPNVKQHLVCSFAGLHILLLSLSEFIIPECIQRAMHLLLPCCHHIKYIKNKFLCSNWFSNMLSFWNIPAITTKKCFDSLGQDLVHLINLSFLLWDFKKYFTIYLLYAFGLFNVGLYFIIFLQIPASADRNFDLWYHHIPALPVYLNISINQVISILTFINLFLFFSISWLVRQTAEVAVV